MLLHGTGAMIAAIGLTHFFLRRTTVLGVHRGVIVVDTTFEPLVFFRDTNTGVGFLCHLEDGIAFTLGDDGLVHDNSFRLCQVGENQGMPIGD